MQICSPDHTQRSIGYNCSSIDHVKPSVTMRETTKRQHYENSVEDKILIDLDQTGRKWKLNDPYARPYTVRKVIGNGLLRSFYETSYLDKAIYLSHGVNYHNHGICIITYIKN